MWALSMGELKSKVFWTREDLEHCAKGSGLSHVQREASGKEGGYMIRLVWSVLILCGSYLL